MSIFDFVGDAVGAINKGVHALSHPNPAAKPRPLPARPKPRPGTLQNLPVRVPGYQQPAGGAIPDFIRQFSEALAADRKPAAVQPLAQPHAAPLAQLQAQVRPRVSTPAPMPQRTIPPAAQSNPQDDLLWHAKVQKAKDDLHAAIGGGDEHSIRIAETNLDALRKSNARTAVQNGQEADVDRGGVGIGNVMDEGLLFDSHQRIADAVERPSLGSVSKAAGAFAGDVATLIPGVRGAATAGQGAARAGRAGDAFVAARSGRDARAGFMNFGRGPKPAPRAPGAPGQGSLFDETVGRATPGFADDAVKAADAPAGSFRARLATANTGRQAASARNRTRAANFGKGAAAFPVRHPIGAGLLGLGGLAAYDQFGDDIGRIIGATNKEQPAPKPQVISISPEDDGTAATAPPTIADNAQNPDFWDPSKGGKRVEKYNADGTPYVKPKAVEAAVDPMAEYYQALLAGGGAESAGISKSREQQLNQYGELIKQQDEALDRSLQNQQQAIKDTQANWQMAGTRASGYRDEIEGGADKTEAALRDPNIGGQTYGGDDYMAKYADADADYAADLGDVTGGYSADINAAMQAAGPHYGQMASNQYDDLIGNLMQSRESTRADFLGATAEAESEAAASAPDQLDIMKAYQDYLLGTERLELDRAKAAAGGGADSVDPIAQERLRSSRQDKAIEFLTDSIGTSTAKDLDAERVQAIIQAARAAGPGDAQTDLQISQIIAARFPEFTVK